MYDIDNMIESQYRRPSFFMKYFYLRCISNLRYMLNSISILTLTCVSEKKVLPTIGPPGLEKPVTVNRP